VRLIFQQAVDELAEADRLKDDLVSNVSHELRSPLTYVVGYVDLLLSGDLGDLTPEQRDSLQIVASKTRMLTRLVSDILSYETNEATELMLAEAQLTELGSCAAQDAQLTATKSGIRVLTEFDPEVRPVMVDSERILQVFANLLGNAIKFTPEGGTITVRVQQKLKTMRVEIADTGIGIPADKLSHVFERFYQVDLKTRRRRGGVGLGLAICRQIIEGHGGQIGVTSEEGVGSTFYFELPYVT
jgi:signal transduction histidine kinase